MWHKEMKKLTQCDELLTDKEKIKIQFSLTLKLKVLSLSSLFLSQGRESKFKDNAMYKSSAFFQLDACYTYIQAIPGILYFLLFNIFI